MQLSEFIRIGGRGAVGALAKAIGAHAPDVSRWASGQRPVPADHCPNIERATGGKVRCEDLRPDVDWAYIRASGAQAANPVRQPEPATAGVGHV